jgi:C-5 cytosine-specific DNA methylase
MKPLCYDLYCGLGGWAEGFLAEGYDVVGYDIEAHDYGTGGYPGKLILRDVRSIHGSELKDATCIVGSSPCQEFSYRAMPWKRAKALPPPYLGIELFNAQFRIQREACEAAGRHIPMVVENVRGAQKWVGRARWNYGSFYLWGDVPALMPMRPVAIKNPAQNFSNYAKTGRVTPHWTLSGLKGNGGTWFGDYGAQKAALLEGVKQGGDWLGKNCESSMSRLYSSKSKKRKAASAMIAKIPFPLAQHIARCFKP